MSSLTQILSLFERAGARLVLLLCHHNADPDAVCSAYALSSLLRRLKPDLEVEVGSPGGPSRLSKSILNLVPLELAESPRIEEADVLFLLDTNTVQQLDEWRRRIDESRSPIVVIDHHAAHEKTYEFAELMMVDEGASSTCELVFSLFKESGLPLLRDEALALLIGIAYDSRRFTIARGETFKVLVELVESGAEVERAMQALTLPMDISERVARIKAAKRCELVKEGDWLIATSHVSSFQASAARALLHLGADVAFVAGRKGKQLSISMRSTEEFQRETGIHLGREVASTLEERLEGMGGGHSTSAGFNGTGDVEEALKLCVSIILRRLRGSEQASP